MGFGSGGLWFLDSFCFFLGVGLDGVNRRWVCDTLVVWSS